MVNWVSVLALRASEHLIPTLQGCLGVCPVCLKDAVGAAGGNERRGGDFTNEGLQKSTMHNSTNKNVKNSLK